LRLAPGERGGCTTGQYFCHRHPREGRRGPKHRRFDSAADRRIHPHASGVSGAGRADMINRYDIAYGVGLFASGPYWLINPSARRKVMDALNQRMGRMQHASEAGPTIWIHAVSVGEINATRALIDQLTAARPDLRFV